MTRSPNLSEQNQETRRLSRQITLAVALVAIVLILISIVTVIVNERNLLSNEHQAELTRITHELEHSLEQYPLALLELAEQTPPEIFQLESQNDTAERSLTSPARELLTENQHRYEVVAYLDLAGQVYAYIENLDGMINERMGRNMAFLPLDFSAISDRLLNLAPGETYLDLALGTQGLSQINLFTLVHQDGQPVGLVYLAVSPSEVLGILRATDEMVGRQLPGRRMVWMQDGTTLVAQNVNEALPQNRAWLQAVEQLNSGTLPPYRIRGMQGYVLSGENFGVEAGSVPAWQLVVVDQWLTAYGGSLLIVTLIVLAGVGSATFASQLIRRMVVPYLQRINETEALIRQVAGVPQETILTPEEVGLRERSNVPVADTIEELANRIQSLSDELAERTARRERDLLMAGRIGRETATQRDLDTLVRHTINMICKELGVYHAQVFLLDPSNTYAELRYSRGDAGEQMLAKRHRLAVGSRTVVGRTVGERRAVIVNDTLIDDEPHLYNPLLPDTRSEMGLPLIVGEDVIGALDIQSRRPHAFQKEDLAIYRLLADQLAIAIHNARLYEQAQDQINQINRLNRAATLEDWQEYQKQAEALELGSQDIEEGGKAAIQLRGTVIGELRASLEDGQPLSKSDQIILDAVAERVAMALENARLLQQTQYSLNEVSTLYTLANLLNEANSPQEVLLPILETVAIGATRAQIWLFRQEYLPGEPMPPAHLAADVRTDDMATTPLDMGRKILAAEHPVLRQLTQKHALCIEDLHAVGMPMGQHMMPRAQTHALVVIPLVMRQSWKGFIAIAFAEPRTFNDTERRLYNALISQAGTAIDNRLLLEQTETALTQQERLYRVSREINTMRSLVDLVKALVITNDTPYTDFWFVMLEGERLENGWTSHARVIARSEDDQIIEEDLPYALQVNADSSMLRRDVQIFTSDRAAEDAAGLIHPAMSQRRAYNTLAFFPMFSENHPTALLVIASVEIRDFTLEDIEFYRAITGQMSTQIERLKAQEQMQDAFDEIRRLYAASRQISGARDTHDLYELFAQHVRSPLLQEFSQHGEASRVGVSLLTAYPKPTPNAPYLREAYQWPEKTSSDGTTAHPLLHSQEKLPLETLLRENDYGVMTIQDIRQEVPANYPDLTHVLGGGWAAAAAIAPLWTAQRWLGVLVVRVEDVELLSQKYINYLESITTQAAVALENQILILESDYERTRLQSILDSVPTGVLVLDGETLKPVQHNQQAERLLGREIDYDRPFRAADYDIQRTGTELPYHEEELPTAAARNRRQTVMVDDIAINRSGIFQISLLLTAAPIIDDSGRVTTIVAGIQDISTLRNMEQTMQENLRETVLLYETQRAVSESESLEELLDNLLGQLQLQPCADAYIILSEEEEEYYHLARYSVQPLRDVDALRPLLTPSIVNINDVVSLKKQPTLYHSLTQIGARSALVVPLRALSRQQPLGWLMLVDTHPEAYTHDQERVLTSMSEMASTSIENKYLIESTSAALETTAALYAATTGISRARDRQGLIETVRNALVMLEADMYAVYLYENQSSGELLKVGFREAERQGLDLSRLAKMPLPQADTVYFQDRVHRGVGTFGDIIASHEAIGALAAVDLQVQNVPTGRIFIGYTGTHVFDENDRRYLGAVADSASIVLDNQALLAQVQATLQEQSVLYQASKALSEITQPEEVIDVVVDFVIEPHMNQVFVVTLTTPRWDHPEALARIVSSWQESDGIDMQGLVFTRDEFPAWELLATDRIIAFDDINDERDHLAPDILENIISLDVRSLAIIPLRIASQDIGAVWVSSREPHHFQDRDFRIFQAFAEQSSRALQASYLLEQTERRARQLETSAIIGQSVGQLLDLDSLLPQVVDLLRDQFNYDHVQIFLMDDANEYAMLAASTGEAGQQLLQMKHKLPRGSRSVIGQVTEYGAMAIAQDTTADDVIHIANPQLPLTRSEIAMPLFIQGQVVGALDVQSNVPNAFTEEDKQTLETLAAQISVAVENARLYDKAAQQASEMGFLFNITTSAAAAQSLDEALQRVADELRDTIHAHAVVIYVPVVYEDLEGSQITFIEKRAVSSGLPLDDIISVEWGSTDHLIGIVASDVRPRLIRLVEEELAYAPLSERTRSACLMPISSGETFVGLIQLESIRPYAFNDDTLTVLRALTSSLSVIIQNTRLVEQLGETVDQLREVDRLKSQFLANMSHELRTPLNSIIGFSRVMLRGMSGPLTDMQEQDLQTIFNSGNHLLSLINEILDQAKIERNELSLKFDEFDVNPLIDSVKSIALGLVREKPVQLRVEVAPNVAIAYGDETRSRQILLNLVNNAIKFTTEGYVAIIAYMVEEESGRRMVRFDVEDTGIGIAKEDIPTIFEQFRQVDSSLTRTAGGTGLGLPISKALAEMQGGELLVESEVNVGSTFSFTVPIEPALETLEEGSQPGGEGEEKPRHRTGQIIVDKEKLGIADAKENGTPEDEPEYDPNATVVIQRGNLQPPQTRKKTKTVIAQKRQVLLIEDDKDMVDQYRRILQPAGFEVMTADMPLYAEAMVGTLRPNVVVLDVNFAKGKGWQLLESLKERDDSFDIPVIVCTENGDPEQAFRLGAHSYLPRPVDRKELMDAVLAAEKESRRERILIIDDQPDALRLLAYLLDEHGDFRVFTAQSGDEGIRMVAQRRPDLVILDLRMPGKDGFAVLDELRDNPETANIPVLVVTGDVDLSASEQESLANIRIVPKTDISREEYARFIDNVRAYLAADEDSE